MDMMRSSAQRSSPVAFVTPLPFTSTFHSTGLSVSRFDPDRPHTLLNSVRRHDAAVPHRSAVVSPVARVAAPPGTSKTGKGKGSGRLRYREKYPLLDGAVTLTHAFTDPRGHAWTYESDSLVLHAEEEWRRRLRDARASLKDAAKGEEAAKVHLVVLQAPTGLGITRYYWDPFFDELSAAVGAGALQDGEVDVVEVHRFDWVGTGSSTPKPDYVADAYDADFFVAQLAHFCSTLPSRARLVILAHGTAEPFALRLVTSPGPIAAKVSGLIVTTGLSTTGLSKRPSAARRAFSYGLLRGWFGRLFYKSVARRDFIDGFTRKNLFLCTGGEKERQRLEQYVDAAADCIDDPRIRFSIFSFFAGYHFDDYRPAYAALPARMRLTYFAGTAPQEREEEEVGEDEDGEIAQEEGKETLNKGDKLDAQIKSLRAPIPIAVTERSFRDDQTERLRFRQALAPHCKGVIIPNAAYEMCSEQADAVVPRVIEFLNDVASSSSDDGK